MKFNWTLHKIAEEFLLKEVNLFLKHHSYANKLAIRMKKKTSTRFFDWVDHIVLPAEHIDTKKLKKLGFTL